MTVPGRRTAQNRRKLPPKTTEAGLATSSRKKKGGFSLSGWDFDVRRGRVRFRDLCSVLTKAVQVERDRFPHLPLSLRTGAPCGDAAGNVRGVRRESCRCRLNHNQVSHRFKPACLNTLFRVPGARSLPGLPATVTRPGFDACFSWRCEPRWRTTAQPSSSNSLMISRTFTIHPEDAHKASTKRLTRSVDLPRSGSRTRCRTFTHDLGRRLRPAHPRAQAGSVRIALATAAISGLSAAAPARGSKH